MMAILLNSSLHSVLNGPSIWSLRPFSNKTLADSEIDSPWRCLRAIALIDSALFWFVTMASFQTSCKKRWTYWAIAGLVAENFSLTIWKYIEEALINSDADIA